MGRARLGMTVADRLRRNRKMTITTSAMVRRSVNFTSATDSRMDCDRSMSTSSFTDAGICDRKEGRRALTASTTSTVFVPGWRWMVRTSARGQGSGVELQAHRVLLRAVHPDLGHPADRRDALGQQRLRVLVHLGEG